MPESFVFYESYLKGIELQDEEVQNRLFLAICRYALHGEEPTDLCRSELGIFELMRPTIDSNTQRRENSQKGGRPKKESTVRDVQQEKPMVSENVKTKKPMVSENEKTEKPMVLEKVKTIKPNENENEDENINENENEDKTEQGEVDYSVVKLSESEKDELVKMSDRLSVQNYIKKLSKWQQDNYKLSGKAYTVIKNWIMQDTIKDAKRKGFFPASSDSENYKSYSVNELTALADSFLERNKDMINNL